MKDASREQGLGPTWVLFGELLADRFPDGEVAGGAPFNVAAHLAALRDETEGAPLLVSRIGQDTRGEFLLARLREVGLRSDAVQRDAVHPSGCVEVSLEQGTHAFDIGANQAWDFIAAAPALHSLAGHEPRWFYFGTLAQRGLSREALRSLLRSSAARGFLDVNLREAAVSPDLLEWSLAHAEVLKLNDDELQRITDTFGISDGVAQERAIRLMQRFGIECVIVTEGERGAWSLDAGARLVRSSPEPALTDFRDSVGAGDAFAAVCLLGMVRGWPEELLLQRANRFAREICRIRGAVPTGSSFYADFHREFATSLAPSS